MNTSPETKLPYKDILSIQEGINALDSPDIMIATIRLQNTTNLKALVNHIRNKQLCCHFSATLAPLTREQVQAFFPEEISPFTTEETKRTSDTFIICPTDKPLFTGIFNQQISLKTLTPLFVQGVAIQSDSRHAITKEPHRDSNPYTVCFYGEGEGLQYQFNGQKFYFKSPVITMHRGKLHNFGEDYAILHQGRIQTGARASITYELGYTEPALQA